MELTREEKKLSIKIAEDAIRSLFYEDFHSEVNLEKYPFLENRAGAFVTLKKNEMLRGCIGYIITELPLYETIKNAAIQAATSDPRFPSLTEEELEDIELEVSILSEPYPMKSYDEIELGKHGLILEEDFARGLLLPQVATEHNMTKEEFLSSLCRKAGLPADLWKKKKLNINLFTASVFSDKELENEDGSS